MKNVKIKNPFKKEKTLGQKIESHLPIQHKQNKKSVIVHSILRFLLYLSLFSAGYITAQIQRLLTL